MKCLFAHFMEIYNTFCLFGIVEIGKENLLILNQQSARNKNATASLDLFDIRCHERGRMMRDNNVTQPFFYIWNLHYVNF